ncbi:hypothetical protein EKH55_5614 (plasmid) [Sinorhizobium alkalisoli]|nr:hypothetical protein EKH55_5614 [Sinorhizobium alkalisoli]
MRGTHVEANFRAGIFALNLVTNSFHQQLARIESAQKIV